MASGADECEALHRSVGRLRRRVIIYGITSTSCFVFLVLDHMTQYGFPRLGVKLAGRGPTIQFEAGKNASVLLKDSMEKVRAVVSADESGQPTITLLDDGGMARMGAVASATGPAWILADKAGNSAWR